MGAKQAIRHIIENTDFYYSYLVWKYRRAEGNYLRQWSRDSTMHGPSPHATKQKNVRTVAKRFGLEAFVETGTYLGEMVQAVKNEFDVLYSIELSPYFYRLARRRFRKDENVHIVEGDSAQQLGPVVQSLNLPTLFWLDGHYSGGRTGKGEDDTPITHELRQIVENASVPYAVIVDDARCFVGENGYPTANQFRHFVQSTLGDFDMKEVDDCFQITPSHT